MVKRRHVGTGLAFVSFSSPEEATHARTALSSPSYTRAYCGRRLAARRAPEPSDVKWENLEVTRRERWRRQLASTGVMLVVASFGTAIISVVCYIQGERAPPPAPSPGAAAQSRPRTLPSRQERAQLAHARGWDARRAGEAGASQLAVLASSLSSHKSDRSHVAQFRSRPKPVDHLLVHPIIRIV